MSPRIGLDSAKKQILSIGKKRQRLHDEDDAIEDGSDGYNSSSDEEEGRTSAVREKKKRPIIQPSVAAVAKPVASDDVTPDVIEPTPSKKKKKKKGKKERAKENNESAAEPSKVTTTDAPSEIKEDAKGKDTASAPAVEAADDDPKKSDTTSNPTPKRKRRKVRSRQKNIYKDNRAANDKPDYLVPGKSDYNGRPMTKETRKRLGLAETTTSSSKKGKRSTAGAAFDSGEWVGGGGGDETKGDPTANDTDAIAKDDAGETVATSQSKPKEGGSDALTKIGDCIVGNTGAPKVESAKKQEDDVGESFGDSKDKKQKKKKKLKKKKFKNLVVG